MGYVPDQVVKTARHDRCRDNEVYKYFLAQVALQKQEDRAAERVGWILMDAIRKRDPSTVLKMIALAKRQRKARNTGVEGAEEWVDPTGALFVFHVGWDAERKLERNPPYNLYQLAKTMRCDKRTVVKLCRRYHVTLQKGKPGLKPKSK